MKDFAALTQKPAIAFSWSDQIESVKLSEYFRRAGSVVLGFSFYQNALKDHEERMRHLHDLYDFYEALDEADGSRAHLLNDLAAQSAGDSSLCRFDEEPQYFYAPYLPREGDILIDAGSYDGMTAADFASMGVKVYSFEMDEHNFPACAKNAEKYGFTVENMGLSSEKKTVRYFRNDAGSTVNIPGTDEASLIDLDTYVRERGLSRVDFIKMDIEGSELDALRGAASSIVKYKPRLAICIYHKPEDPWTIPQYIKALRPDYDFSFRHYRGKVAEFALPGRREDFIDLVKKYGLDDTVASTSDMVLYAR